MLALRLHSFVLDATIWPSLDDCGHLLEAITRRDGRRDGDAAWQGAGRNN